MFGRALLLVALLAGCTTHFTRTALDCRETRACQRAWDERDHAFQQAVAREPFSLRARFSTVAPRVLLADDRQTIWAVEPELRQRDVKTGAVVKAPAARGQALFRVARWLVTTDEVSATLTFVDPASGQARSCPLSSQRVGPRARLGLYPFDREGTVFAWTVTREEPVGGAGRAEPFVPRCQLVEVDPETCTTRPRALADFAWEQAGEGPNACLLEPERALPAFAATLAPRAVDSPVSLHWSSTGDQCLPVTTATLVGRKQDGTELWRQSFEPEPPDNHCAP